MEGLIAKDSTDEETAKRWLDYGNKIVVIKHGKDGSTAYTRDGKAYRIKPFPVNFKILWRWRCLCISIYIWNLRRMGYDGCS